MKNKLTFIIPVHNSSKSLEYCINSICKQSDKYQDNIEIILIENGSTDNSISIAYKIIKENSGLNIKVIYSEKGVSRARNKGIIESKGDYLIFVDSDDKILPNSLDIIFEDLEDCRDIYLYGFEKGKLNTNSVKIIHEFNENKYNRLIEWVMSKPTLRAQAWAKVYKKDILIKNNIMFREDLFYAEDSEFVIRVLNKIKSFKVSNKIIYNYIVSENSAMRSKPSNRIDMYIKSLNYTINEFKVLKYKDTSSLDKYILTHLNIILVHDVFIYENRINKEDNNKIFKEIVNHKIFKESINRIRLRDCLSKELLVEIFIKLKLYFAVRHLCYLKSKLNQK